MKPTDETLDAPKTTLSDLTEKTVRAAERLHRCACEFEEPGACGEYYEHLQSCVDELERFGEKQ